MYYREDDSIPQADEDIYMEARYKMNYVLQGR